MTEDRRPDDRMTERQDEKSARFYIPSSCHPVIPSFCYGGPQMRTLILIAALLIVAAGPQTPAPAPAPPSSAPPPIVLKPAIPGDVNVTATTVSIDAFQPDFDVH